MSTIEMRLTLDESGRFGLSGIPDNLVIAYGLLEIAKIAIADRARQAERIIQPTLVMPEVRHS